MYDLKNMTVGEFKDLIGEGGGDSLSKQFAEKVYKTREFRFGDYASQREHLKKVTDSIEEDRPLSAVIAREQNCAQILLIYFIVGVEEETLKDAYERGKDAWTEAGGTGFPVSAACAKSAAVIRAYIEYPAQDAAA